MKWKNFLLLLTLAAVWGPSYLFIKVAVAEIPPLTLVLGRVALAALVLLLILWLQGQRLPPWGAVWKHLAVVAFIHNAFPFVLYAWGEQHISSALASILNGVTPLFTLLLAHLVTDDDQMTPTKVTGTLLGFAGLLLLIGPPLLDGVEATALGVLALTVASACYGVAIVYARQHLRHVPPLVAPAGQMLLATLYLLPLTLWLERPFALPLPSLPALGSVVALAVLGTAVGFVVYYRLLARASASYVATVTYLLPVVGIALGAVVLSERLAWNAYAGCALILLGVTLANGVLPGLYWPRASAAPGAALNK